jgi:polysaccharide export outer membrane protein
VAYFSRAFCVGLVVVLAGCAKAPEPSTNTTAAVDPALLSAQPTAVAGISVDMNSQAPETVAAAQPVAAPAAARIPASAATLATLDLVNEYRIAPQDVLDITVFRVPELSKTVPVSAAGLISLPLIGEVQAAGQSPAELESVIAAKLQADFIQSPDVTVFVKDAVSQRVTVEGAVNNPGIYPTDGTTTLLQVVALAGGLDRIADSRGIVVFRNVEGQRQAAKFDYKAIRAGTADDPPIVGGDVVVIDESGAKAAMRDIRESISLFGLFMPFI